MKIVMFHDTGLSFNQIRDEDHIEGAFIELGHEVFTNDKTKVTDADFILCFKSHQVGPNTIDELRGLTKAPIFGWTCDNMERFKAWYEVAKKLDLWLGEELGRTDRWKQEGIPFYYFPQHFANPKHFYQIPLERKKYDVTFTGTPYNNDVNDKFKILKAVDGSFNLHVFGNNPNGWKSQGFKNVHDYAFDANANEVFNQSKIVLAISNSRVQGYWSVRQSCVMMSHSFCLTRYAPHMEKESRNNVVYWNDQDDLLQKVGYYLEHDEERFSIAMGAGLYAMQNLTVLQRVKELLIII